jgi:heme a synthase
MNAASPAADARLRRLALACWLLMLAVVLASAWLRLAQPRPTCGDWPACRSAGQTSSAPAAAPVLGRPGTLDGVRAVHRVAASAFLPAAALLAWLALARPPRQPALGRRALAMLLLALALAGLGIVTPGSDSAGVLLGNLLGGQWLLALAWSVLRGLHSGRLPTSRTAGWALGAAVLWALQAALGALSGAGHGWVTSIAHLLLTMPALAWAGAVAVAAWRQGCGDARVLLALLALQPMLGVASFLLAAPTALVLLHNLTAALGLSVLYGLGDARR